MAPPAPSPQPASQVPRTEVIHSSKMADEDVLPQLREKRRKFETQKDVTAKQREFGLTAFDFAIDIAVPEALFAGEPLEPVLRKVMAIVNRIAPPAPTSAYPVPSLGRQTLFPSPESREPSGLGDPSIQRALLTKPTPRLADSSRMNFPSLHPSNPGSARAKSSSAGLSRQSHRPIAVHQPQRILTESTAGDETAPVPHSMNDISAIRALGKLYDDIDQRTDMSPKLRDVCINAVKLALQERVPASIEAGIPVEVIYHDTRRNVFNTFANVDAVRSDLKARVRNLPPAQEQKEHVGEPVGVIASHNASDTTLTNHQQDLTDTKTKRAPQKRLFQPTRSSMRMQIKLEDNAQQQRDHRKTPEAIFLQEPTYRTVSGRTGPGRPRKSPPREKVAAEASHVRHTSETPQEKGPRRKRQRLTKYCQMVDMHFVGSARHSYIRIMNSLPTRVVKLNLSNGLPTKEDMARARAILNASKYGASKSKQTPREASSVSAEVQHENPTLLSLPRSTQPPPRPKFKTLADRQAWEAEYRPLAMKQAEHPQDAVIPDSDEAAGQAAAASNYNGMLAKPSPEKKLVQDLNVEQHVGYSMSDDYGGNTDAEMSDTPADNTVSTMAASSQEYSDESDIAPEAVRIGGSFFVAVTAVFPPFPNVEKKDVDDFHKGFEIAIENIIEDHGEDEDLNMQDIIQNLENERPDVRARHSNMVLKGSEYVYAALEEAVKDEGLGMDDWTAIAEVLVRMTEHGRFWLQNVV